MDAGNIDGRRAIKMRTKLPCLPLIQEKFWNVVKDKKEYAKSKYLPEFEIYMFPQVWGDTSLGFGGVGGQAMTSAYTTVIIDEFTGWCGIFFGERLAYLVLNPNQLFYEDLHNWNMESVRNHGKYLRG